METRFTVRLPKELADKLKKLAKKKNRSVNKQLIELLERYFEEREK